MFKQKTENIETREEFHEIEINELLMRRLG